MIRRLAFGLALVASVIAAAARPAGAYPGLSRCHMTPVGDRRLCRPPARRAARARVRSEGRPRPRVWRDPRPLGLGPPRGPHSPQVTLGRPGRAGPGRAPRPPARPQGAAGSRPRPRLRPLGVAAVQSDDDQRPRPARLVEGGPAVAADRPHELRHTAITTWAEAGISAKRLSVWAGHRSVAFTLDRYAGVFEQREQSEAGRVPRARRLGGASGTACGTERVRIERSIAVHSGSSRLPTPRAAM